MYIAFISNPEISPKTNKVLPKYVAMLKVMDMTMAVSAFTNTKLGWLSDKKQS